MYSVVKTETFEKWLESLKDPVVRMRVVLRITQIENGNFGDYRSVGEGVSELRFHMASGLRVYYTIRGLELVILLAGGDKSSQTKDIVKAQALAKEIS